MPMALCTYQHLQHLSQAYSQVLVGGHCVPDTVGSTAMQDSRIPVLRQPAIQENRKTVRHGSLFLESTVEYDRLLYGKNLVPEVGMSNLNSYQK